MKRSFKKTIGLFLSVLMTLTMIPILPAAAETEDNQSGQKTVSNSFQDVQETDWFYDSVMYVKDRDLMKGTSDTIFEPQITMSRAMTVTVLHRMEGEPAAENPPPFKDVPDNAWYTDAVAWAAGEGIVNGYNENDFGPSDHVTREQTAAILFRYSQKKGYDISGRGNLKTFADSDDVSEWAYDALSWANAEGLITGFKDHTLAPGADTTRAQTAAILQRFCENTAKKSDDPDEDRIDEEIITGNFEMYSSYTYGKILKDSFYYSDKWFQNDPALKNDSLALLSMQTVAAFSDAVNDVRGKNLLQKLGFSDIRYYGIGSDDPEDCAFALGYRTLEDNSRVVAFVVLNYSFDQDMKRKGWVQNFTVNGETAGSEHCAYSIAADDAFDKIRDLNDGNTKFWIMGHSRGAALANVIASRLPADLTYAYTFEAPATTGNAGDYPNIHNYICSDDPVTMIPPWGMTRYGETHQLDIEADISAELKKLESDAVNATDMDAAVKIKKLDEILTELTRAIPERQDYSAEQQLPDGTVYTCQEAFVKLMNAVFSDTFSAIDTSTLTDQIVVLKDGLLALQRGLRGDTSDPDREFWYAAQELHGFIGRITEDSPLEVRDLFLLLKAGGDILIDQDAETEGLSDIEIVADLISPAVNILYQKDALLYSHHFDTAVARLKVMAPAPELQPLNLSIKKPSAGDASEQAVRELQAAIDPDLSPEVSWLSSDSELQNDRTYNLEIVFHTPGRNAESFAVLYHAPNRQSEQISPGMTSAVRLCLL